MTMKNFLLLLVAAAVMGAAVPGNAAAQSAAAGGATAQSEVPEAVVKEAIAWEADKNAATKLQKGKELITQYPGTKVAERIMGLALNDMGQGKTFSNEQGLEFARTYVDTYTKANKQGAYLEYALSWLATSEPDPAKQIEYANQFLKTFPQSQHAARAKAAVAAARYRMFEAALKAKNVDQAAKIANDAMAAGDPEFGYIYLLTSAAGADLATNTINSALVGRAGDWAAKGIAYVESGKVPDPAPAQAAAFEKAKPQTLNLLYRVRGHDALLRAAKKGQAATPEDYAQAAQFLDTAVKHNAQDILAQYFLGQAYHFQYAAHAAKYQTFPEDQAETEEAKAVLAKLNEAADKVIETWARVMSLAGNDPLRKSLKEAVQPTVVELYKYRHPESPDGWQTLVTGGAAPSTSSASR